MRKQFIARIHAQHVHLKMAHLDNCRQSVLSDKWRHVWVASVVQELERAPYRPSSGVADVRVRVLHRLRLRQVCGRYKCVNAITKAGIIA